MDIAWTNWVVECLIVGVCDSGWTILEWTQTKLFKDEKKIFKEKRNIDIETLDLSQSQKEMKQLFLFKFCLFVCKKK